jgi:hypothetical protein
MLETILAFGGLCGLLIEMARRDKFRYREGNMVEPVLNGRIARIGGIWFFHLGRLGGSFYIRRKV